MTAHVSPEIRETPCHTARHPGSAMFLLPYDAPDRRTSMADLRTAICLKNGVHIDDIDPASGYDHSRAGYETVRASWSRLYAEDPNAKDSAWFARHYAKARANWLRIRPDWDDDWLAPETPAVPEPSMLPLFELETSR